MEEKAMISGVLVAKCPVPPNERIGIFISLTKFLIAYGYNEAFFFKQIRRNYKQISLLIEFS